MSFLDGHDVSCDAGTALSRWQLQSRLSGSQIRYGYTCVSPKATGVASRTTTIHSDWANMATFVDLRLIDVTCPSSRPAMKGWRFYRLGGQGLINVYCAAVDGSSLSCDQRSTDMSDAAGGANTLLGDHNVQCGCCEGGDAVDMPTSARACPQASQASV